MTDATNSRSDDLLADDALRAVIGGESGERMISAVANILHSLRNMSPDDRDDSVGELSDVDSVFPYTYDRIQAFAESIHHATYENDMDDCCGGFDTAMDAVASVVGSILRGATCWLIQNEV